MNRERLISKINQQLSAEEISVLRMKQAGVTVTKIAEVTGYSRQWVNKLYRSAKKKVEDYYEV